MVGSFGNDGDGNGNENVKQQLCTCSTLSCTILCRHWRITTANSNFPVFQTGKIATKFEKTRSPLNSEVFAAVADVVDKREFSNDDGDGNGNDNVKTTIGFLRNTTSLHVQHALLYISLPLLHDYDVKMLNFTFYGGRKEGTTRNAGVRSPRNQLQGNKPSLDIFSELE